MYESNHFLSSLEVFEKISNAIDYAISALSREGTYVKEGFTHVRNELVFNEKFQTRGWYAVYKKGDAEINQFLFSVSLSNNKLNIHFSDEVWRCLYELGLKNETLDDESL